jgi:hypothetical protein
MWTLLLALAWADAECEKRITATGMVFLKDDPKIVCETNPSAETQSCIVELLTKGKGKLRNTDFFEVFGLCRADSTPAIRECLLKGLAKSWNDPAYKSVKEIGGKCLLARKNVPMAKSVAKAAPAAAPTKKTGGR